MWKISIYKLKVINKLIEIISRTLLRNIISIESLLAVTYHILLYIHCTQQYLPYQEHLNTHFLEPDDAPLLPSGKHSILKKRLLKRRNIKDLSAELQPRFFVGFVRHDNDVITDMKVST